MSLHQATSDRWMAWAPKSWTETSSPHLNRTFSKQWLKYEAPDAIALDLSGVTHETITADLSLRRTTPQHPGCPCTGLVGQRFGPWQRYDLQPRGDRCAQDPQEVR